jgi:DNA-binding NtrC family response regulator
MQLRVQPTGRRSMAAHILLIEDNEDLRTEMREFLERRGNTVSDCDTIAGAREALKEGWPDVVVSDINLPDGNGMEFCLAHASQNPHTRWLLLSGDAGRLRQSWQLKSEPSALPVSILEKPVSMKALDEFVRLAMLQAQSTSLLDTRTGESGHRES